MMTRGLLLDLGCAAYDPIHALQLRLTSARVAGTIPDALVIVEHDPVITLGRRADESHVLASPDALARLGISVRRVERGGDVTYHGPGQIVAYPIIRLASHGLGISEYMHLLEEAVIRTVGCFGVRPGRREGMIGVWVGRNKIAALGVRVKRGVTFHGLALNVDPDMSHWAQIIPCGITEGGVTSLAHELGVCPPMQEIRSALVAELSDCLGLQLEGISVDAIEPALDVAPRSLD